MRITIKDIARDLKIHHSTVSRALRNDAKVKVQTRDRILNYAKEHGYQINVNALKLRGSVRNVIAIIIPNIHHHFFSNVVSLITDLASEQDFIVSVFQTNESHIQEKKIIKTVIQNNVAGVIASISLETESSEQFTLLKKFGIPLVFFDRVCKDIDTSKVVINNSEIVKQAVDLLVSKDHRKIAYITGSKHINVFHQRQLGYLAGIEKNGLSYSKRYEIRESLTAEKGIKAISELFNETKTPDAVISDSNNLTYGVILKLRKMNLNIPKDVGIISFGENLANSVIEPTITSIEQPENEIANEVYNLLIAQIENKDTVVNKEIELSAKLIIRESHC